MLDFDEYQELLAKGPTELARRLAELNQLPDQCVPLLVDLYEAFTSYCSEGFDNEADELSKKYGFLRLI